MKKAIITISQEGASELDISVQTWSQDKEVLLGVESHILAMLILNSVKNGSFNSELALQMELLNPSDE